MFSTPFQLSIYLNEEHLTQTERVHICVMRDGHIYTVVLIFDGAQVIDHGTLSFVASNEFGTAKTEMELFVNGMKATVFWR